MEVGFRIVDVFAPRRFAGNPLCVVPDATGLDAATMQSIAAEIGFSESAFVTDARPDRYHLRIFMPDREIPFAGHPTVGAAVVLAQEGRIDATATQIVAAGEVPVEVDVRAATAWMTQPPLAFLAAVDPVLAAAAAGVDPADLRVDLPPRVVSTGLPPLLVAVRDASVVEAARPDPAEVEALCRAVGAEEIYLFAVDGDAAVARFAGFGAVVEDAATGSAAGPLGAYVAERSGRPVRLTVHQGAHLGRPSEIGVEVDRPAAGAGWRVRVGGAVRPVATGTFTL